MTDSVTRITSIDGTSIACWRSGNGPPLLLIPGTSATHERWAPVQGRMEQQFTVYAIDRRGYGMSDDAAGYSIEREFEDVAAVAESIGEPVNLFGHSFGALCALGAAKTINNLRTLILYEPAISTGQPIYPRAVIESMERLLDAGDRDGLVTAMFRDLAGVRGKDLEELKAQPFWKVRVAAAHAILRETHAEESFRFDPSVYIHLDVPTLLLLGGESPEFLVNGTNMIYGALPDCRIVLLPGQGHMAMNTAPELFVRELTNFITN